MVAGKTYDQTYDQTQEMEVMYVNGTTKICNSTANYPENVGYLSGGSFQKNSLIIVCGGYITSACYSMSNDLKWTHFANLTEPKFYSASVMVKNGLWVTGNAGEKFKLENPGHSWIQVIILGGSKLFWVFLVVFK